MSRHLQSTSKLLEAALPNGNKNNHEAPSMPGENVTSNPVKWIRGQNVQLNCDEEEDNQKQRKPCFFSLNHQHRKPCATTLVFSSSSTSTSQHQIPHLGLWYRLNSLDSNHHLRDFVESDILISKKFSSSSSPAATNPACYLLHHIDCQVVFDANLLLNRKSENQQEQPEKTSSGSAFLLHVVEFCPGGSLLNLVQDRLKVVETRKQQRQETTPSSASNHGSILDSLLLPLSSVTRIVHELLKAVHHLHKNLKIVHNAINLHNIFLDSENHVRLGNFSHSFSTAPVTTTTTTGPNRGISSNNRNNKTPLGERKINNNFSSSSSTSRRQLRSASANKNIANNTPVRSRSASKMSSPSRGKSPMQRSCSSPRSSSLSPPATTRFCDFCIHKLPEDEFANRNMNSENDETPLLIKNHIKESRDVFSVGVICYQLLFGTSPPIKSVKNKPETSLAMKLISLREELILSFSDNANNNNNNNNRENSSMMMMMERKKRQEETLLMHNELLCRFLLLSLSILPLDRPRISDCLSMFDNALSHYI